MLWSTMRLAAMLLVTVTAVTQELIGHTAKPCTGMNSESSAQQFEANTNYYPHMSAVKTAPQW